MLYILLRVGGEYLKEFFALFFNSRYNLEFVLLLRLSQAKFLCVLYIPLCLFSLLIVYILVF